LLAWLNEGVNSEGVKYLEMRRRLVSYFDRKNCAVPDELADETLNREARRLEERDVVVGQAGWQLVLGQQQAEFVQRSRFLRRCLRRSLWTG